MTAFQKYAAFLRDNPVVLLDLLKYVIAAAVLFGLPVPPGIDAVVAGVVLGVLTLVTRSQVVPLGKHTSAVEDALASPPPSPDDTGESEYLREIDG